MQRVPSYLLISLLVLSLFLVKDTEGASCQCTCQSAGEGGGGIHGGNGGGGGSGEEGSRACRLTRPCNSTCAWSTEQQKCVPKECPLGSNSCKRK